MILHANMGEAAMEDLFLRFIKILNFSKN